MMCRNVVFICWSRSIIGWIFSKKSIQEYRPHVCTEEVERRKNSGKKKVYCERLRKWDWQLLKRQQQAQHCCRDVFFIRKRNVVKITVIEWMFSIINYGKIRYFSLFSLNFRFASIFSLKFRLFYLRFRFRFLVFCIKVNHVKSGFFFASKRNEIFASISNFAFEAKVRAHPRRKDTYPFTL